MVTSKELRNRLLIFRTRADIEKFFNLSNSESWHLLKWYIKAKCIECKNVTGLVKKRGIIKLYRWCDTEVNENETCDNDTEQRYNEDSKC